MHVFYTPDIQSHCQELPGRRSRSRSPRTAAANRRRGNADRRQRQLLPCGNQVPPRPSVALSTYFETIPKRLYGRTPAHCNGSTKNMDRTEWFAEKATEIGFDELTFLNCRFSERKVIKTERIAKILVSAIKQSLKARLPQPERNDRFQLVHQPAFRRP